MFWGVFVEPPAFDRHRLVLATTDRWDEDGAIAPTHVTVLSALYITLLLTMTGYPIYHTSLGPVSEVMINLRNGGTSAELLIYPGDHQRKEIQLLQLHPTMNGDFENDLKTGKLNCKQYGNGNGTQNPLG